MKTFFDIQIPNTTNSIAELVGAWERKRNWDWNGVITAKSPIAAVSFLRVRNRIEWARSQKELTAKLDVRLLLGIYDSDPRDVSVGFSIGVNGPRWRTLLGDPNEPPEISKINITIGKPFVFCKSFGTPAIELFGLVILREQVVGARNGLWHIKGEFANVLPSEWFSILTNGRVGWFKIEN